MQRTIQNGKMIQEEFLIYICIPVYKIVNPRNNFNQSVLISDGTVNKT